MSTTPSDPSPQPPPAAHVPPPQQSAPRQPSASGSNRGLWTILIVFGGLFLIFAVLAVVMFGAMSRTAFGKNQIGVIEVTGPISSSDQFLEDLRYFEEQDQIKGIVIRIDSPGGAVGASQEIHEAIGKSDKKMVISLGNVAASGGYYIAVSGPRIFANPGTVTGSIGVISQQFEVDALMDYLQVKVNTVTSGEYKDTGSPFRDFTEKDRALYQALVTDIYEQFFDAVVQGRNLTEAEVRPWADGRVFTGRQAHKAKLVDELGGFDAAVDWLMDDLGLEGEPTLVYPPRRASGLFDVFLEQSLGAVRDNLGKNLQSAQSPTFEYRFVGPGSAP